MNSKNFPLFIFVLLCMGILFNGCKKDSTGTTNVVKQKITGYIQKGPFITGSSITLYDLNEDLSPTGKSFNTQTSDNKGTFGFSQVTLSSKYATLKADGYYYNEVLGALSQAPITLYALADLTDSANINVNVITDLEKARVEYLMQNGKSFAESKKQAEKDILAIFYITKPDIKSSEKLNISETGDDNLILLAISSILQRANYNEEGRLSQYLSEISNDIKEDGILSSNVMYKNLLENAVYFDTSAVKTNLIKKYGELGTTVNDLNFGKYVEKFIDSVSLRLTGSEIYYPNPFPEYGSQNFLDLSDTVYHQLMPSLAAYLPYNSTLKIKISQLDADFSKGPNLYYLKDGSPYTQVLPDSVNGTYYVEITFPLSTYFFEIYSGHHYLVEYFENGSAVPTRHKIVRSV